MHLSSVDLNLLPVLDALLEARSVSAAARRANLSQSAMSHALARLRVLLGDPILVRGAGGLVPTTRAEQMREPLRAQLTELGRTLFHSDAFNPETAERMFQIGSSDYAEFVLLPPLMKELRVVAPAAGVWVRPHTDEAQAQLARSELDLILAPMRNSDLVPGMRHLSLFDERFVCVVRKRHPLTRGRLTLKRFLEAKHAFIAPRGSRGGAVDDALAAMGLSRQVAFAVPHFLVAPEVVAQSDLVLTVAERVARAFADRLAIVEAPLELPGFSIEAMWHERHERDLAHAWFRGLLGRVAGHLRSRKSV